MDIDAFLMPPPPKRLRDDTEHSSLARDHVEFSIMPTEHVLQSMDQSRGGPALDATENIDFPGTMQQDHIVGVSSLPVTINFVTPPKTEALSEAGNRDTKNFSETDSLQSERSTVIAESMSESSENQEQRHEEIMPETTIARFSDIIGHASVKLRIDEMLLPLALPPALADSILTGVRSLPASLLLYGPPGCGKVRFIIMCLLRHD